MVELRGQCACGMVSYEISGALGHTGACHCTTCRRTSGLYWAATGVKDKDIKIYGDTLKWFKSSDWASRGFCGNCGSSLFYKLNDSDHIEVATGSMDQPSHVKIEQHIFVAEKGDYYDICDQLPQKQQCD